VFDILGTMPDAPADRAIDPALLEMLRCPLTLSRLRVEADELVAEVGGLRYPVREGIPQMLPEEARLPEGIASLEDLKSQLREKGQLRPGA
jgi:hypothetical protein